MILCFSYSPFEIVTPHWQVNIALGHRLSQLMQYHIHWQALIITRLKSILLLHSVYYDNLKYKDGGINDGQVNILCLRLVHLNGI